MVQLPFHSSSSSATFLRSAIKESHFRPFLSQGKKLMEGKDDRVKSSGSTCHQKVFNPQQDLTSLYPQYFQALGETEGRKVPHGCVILRRFTTLPHDPASFWRSGAD